MSSAWKLSGRKEATLIEVGIPRFVHCSLICSAVARYGNVVVRDSVGLKLGFSFFSESRRRCASSTLKSYGFTCGLYAHEFGLIGPTARFWLAGFSWIA